MPQTLNIPEIYRISHLTLLLRSILTTGMLILGSIEIVKIFQHFSIQWFWLILATYYTITVNETFVHRICGHKLFLVNVKSWTYKLLVFIASADLGHGPVRALAIGHRAHHIYADQGDADPANVKKFWFGMACALPFRGWFKNPKIPNPKSFLSKSYRLHREIIDDPWTKFCEKYQILISITYVVLLYFLFPTFLFKVVLPGRVILVISLLLIGFCHSKNVPLTYRHVNTADDSNNNLILHYMFLGIFSGFLQNNHHSYPNLLNLGRTWYEIDTSAPMAYLLKFLIEKKKYENI